MRKNIDFSKLSLRQIAFFFVGLAIAVTGLVFSIIAFATALFDTDAVYPIDLSVETKQLVCDPCDIAAEQSLWLALPNRQIEYTDIGIDVFIGDGATADSPTSSTSFVLVGVRNQFGGKVFYRLQSLEEFVGSQVAISVRKTGSDEMNVPASIAIRTYQGVEINPFYVGLMVLGIGLIVFAFRRPPSSQNAG
ncbi:hypothetical protein EOI86_22840 [Hwanghaeella grinnelliae]|uniref:Uncharacterized protein n=1 Tax=Hwanghaeella grinnelliae TaxID=2500179 RepID=A0A3S2WPD8_9PROT|nr:hypothetical protein [Hwanghaeella grinnelliae]RVU33965.1 hypothetical protein EOI86_22840 [Hwanghaeella grinnelliae]